MSQSKVQHIFRVFDALNVVKGIKAVGGPDHQTYYIESDVYAPDRRITPLILQPYVEVSDPNGVIPAGDKIGELSSASWYVGEAILANKITDKESEATMDTPFAIGENNALHIRKNSTKSILLIFEGEYLDIRKDKNIHISLTYTLTTTSNTEVKPAPKLMLSKPQSWKYCPLENQTKAVIEATVSQDSKLYRSAVQWVKVEGDKETLIGEDDPFYIEGQNTDKLTINPSLMGSTLIRAKNHDELFYNQVYGINPEWDHRMDEVMRNRNLVNKESVLEGYYIQPSSNDLNKMNGPLGLLFKVKYGEVYSFQILGDENNGNRRALSFYDSLEHGSKPIETVVYRENSPFKKIVIEGLKVPSGAKYMIIYLANENYGVEKLDLNNFKLERAEKCTSYTPAPEDLNTVNLIKNSGFQNRGAHWKAGNNTAGALFINGKMVLEAGNDEYQNIPSSLLKNKGKLYASLWLERFDKNVIIELRFGGSTAQKKFEGGNIKFLCSEITDFGNGNFILDTSGQGSVIVEKVSLTDKPVGVDGWLCRPEELAPDGILKGTYQSDIKFTRYFPKLETEIDFLTGDTLRAGMDTVKMKAVFKTNKEEIKNPEQYFDIKWYLDPVEAGGSVEFLGEGEYLDVLISKIPLKARAIPFRLEYEFK